MGVSVRSAKVSVGNAWSAQRVCLRALAVVGIAFLAGSTVRATSIVPPQNLGEVAHTSNAVLLAQAGTSTVAQRGPLLFTLTTFRVLEVVAGELARGDQFTVEAPGGELNGITWAVPGSPRFEPGEVYMLFLDQKTSGEWRPRMLAYGLLHRIRGRDASNLLAPLSEYRDIQPFPRADGTLPEPVETYRETALVPHLREIVASQASWDFRKVLARNDQVPLQAGTLALPSGCTNITGGTPYARWPYNVSPALGQVTMYAQAGGDPSISGGGFAEVQAAIGMWMGIPNTSLNLAYGGARSYTLQCTGGCTSGSDHIPCANPFGSNTGVVVFNDPCGEIGDLSGCSGILGFGGPYWGSTHTFDGTTWYSISSWFVVLNNGVGCLGSTYYQRMLGHELGHGLGFGHFSDPNALMYAYCCNTIDSTDTTCAQYTYPGSGNPAPTVTGVSPGSGPTTGGTGITVRGTGFQTGATVKLGGASATGVSVANSTTITATTGAHAAGTVDVVVQNPDSQTGTLTNGFTYVNCSAPSAPALTAPASAASGTAYTVSWTATSVDSTYELQESMNVSFSGASTTSVTGTNTGITHTATGTKTYYSRVRAKIMCSGSPYYSGWSNTASTAVSAGGSCGLSLSSQTIFTTQIYASCATLTAGPAVQIAAPGDVKLRAAVSVILRNGFSVQSGARCSAGTDASLAP
jgi:hypothetical protein